MTKCIIIAAAAAAAVSYRLYCKTSGVPEGANTANAPNI